jgi:hypothetical protein
MKQNKLVFGDKQFIADALDCSKVAVEDITSGRRGKRNTLFQRIVKSAISFREKQNEELERFCQAKRMQMERISTNQTQKISNGTTV